MGNLCYGEENPKSNICVEGEDEQPPIVPDAVPVDSLRHQMDRQCKQRRVNYSEMDNGYEIRPDGSGPYSESTMRASSGGMRANSGGYRTNSGALSDAYSGRTHSYTMPKQEQYTMPPYEFAVQAQDGCLKAPESVFSDGEKFYCFLHLHLHILTQSLLPFLDFLGNSYPELRLSIPQENLIQILEYESALCDKQRPRTILNYVDKLLKYHGEADNFNSQMQSKYYLP